MPDQKDTKTTTVAEPVATPDSKDDNDVVAPILPDGVVADGVTADGVPENTTDNSAIIAEVAAKVGELHNILIALSSDPSVDELCAAIGLSLYLDRIGKRVTAIYSGATPNALKFLKPEETFEQNANILQDFVIALDKEKADHLRYKLDGDYVKIFITPYHARITSDDLEFSYGDYNVDLVLALDVANGTDLDDALREHGRIMHDATIVNITTGKPGKLGEIEWSDKTASSVSEMVAELLLGSNNAKFEKDEATAFLTGIVASTDRFASAGTTSKTMEIASKLMEFGANQQLITKNITKDLENEMFSFAGVSEKTENDATKLDIKHGNEQNVDEEKEIDTTVNEKDSGLLDDLKAAENSLVQAVAEVTPEASNQPVKLDELSDDAMPGVAEVGTTVPTATEPAQEAAPAVEAAEATADAVAPSLPPVEEGITGSERVIAPSADFAPETLSEGTNKYGQMLQDALADVADDTPPVPIISSNPALESAPAVASAPEVNGVPEINYMPPADAEILPPPPAPPIDPTQIPLCPQPAMQDQVYQPQAAAPGSFQIPGV
jgi:nanoRNase/pAp phosphatase (c-di-AMP/oligoRNAs hydrolase)